VKRCLVFILCVSVFSSLAAEMFQHSCEGWDANPLAWQFEASGSVIQAKGIGGFVVRDAPDCARVHVSAIIKPKSTVTNEWSTLGVSLFADERNFWHAAIVQAPSQGEKVGRRFFELAEMRNGTWLAHCDDHLPVTKSVCRGTWRPGVPCRVSLESTPDGISAKVVDDRGKLVWERAYAFRERPAVRVGRPALHTTGGFCGTFTDLDLSWTEPQTKNAVETFPPYASDSFVPGITDRATGFFRVIEKDGRWWVIDPLGRGSILLGIDHVTYHGHYSQRTKRGYYHEFNKTKFPNKADWEVETLARLKSWGFNALGAGCDLALAHRGLVHTKFLILGDSLCRANWQGQDPDLFICPNEHRPCSAFPNVFHPLFPVWADYVARQKCAPVRSDPWLFGYFIDNELAWWGRGDLATGLFDAVSQLPEKHSAKVAQRQFLASRGVKGAVPNDVKLDFLKLAAERYFGVSCAAIRRHDPNHLVLGARFAGLRGAHPVVWETAAKHCDVVTFNCYPWADLDRNVMFTGRGCNAIRIVDAFSELYGRVRRPMLVTEWSFPALDSGLPCLGGAGQRFRTQALRTQATELFARTMLALPFLIGYDYFMWVDQPPEGISDQFPEDSNYGLVNERGVAYPEITSMFARLHGNLGSVCRAEIPAERKDADPQGMTAAAFLERTGRATGVSCIRDGDGYSVRTPTGLDLCGRIGGSRIFDSVRLNGRLLGAYTGMWCDKVGEKLGWHDAGKVISAEWREDCGWGVLRVTFEGSSAKTRRIRQTHDLTVFAESPWFLCNLVSLENVGDESIELNSFYFREYAAFALASKEEVSKRKVPNLWKYPENDAWFSASGDAYFGGISLAPTVSQVSFWLSRDGKSRHPDACFRLPQQLVLKPGERYDPKGTVWMIAAAGLDGTEGWQRCVRKFEEKVASKAR